MANFSGQDDKVKMNGPLSTRRLQAATTIDYFLQSLKYGGAGDADLNMSVMHNGAFSVLVPSNTASARLARFSSGGLLAAQPASAFGDGMLQPVPDSVPTLSAIVAQRVRLLDDPILWIHEPLLTEEELTSKQLRCQKLDNQLYLVHAGAIGSEERIAEIIRYSNLSWHFLAFLTDGVHQPDSVSELVERAQMIVVGAYDGESFLFWERS